MMEHNLEELINKEALCEMLRIEYVRGYNDGAKRTDSVVHIDMDDKKFLLQTVAQYLIIDRFYTEKAEHDAEELLDLILSKIKSDNEELKKKLDMAIETLLYIATSESRYDAQPFKDGAREVLGRISGT